MIPLKNFFKWNIFIWVLRHNIPGGKLFGNIFGLINCVVRWPVDLRIILQCQTEFLSAVQVDGERAETNIGFTPLAATVIAEHLSTTAGRSWLRADFDEREETNGPCEKDVAGTKQQQQETKKQTNLKQYENRTKWLIFYPFQEYLCFLHSLHTTWHLKTIRDKMWVRKRTIQKGGGNENESIVC